MNSEPSLCFSTISVYYLKKASGTALLKSVVALSRA
jgi:hypothetical protein